MADHQDSRHPDLGRVLRQEADRHVPDRDAILTRVARRRGEPARGRWAFLALRPVAAAASVVATLVVGVAGVKLIGDRPSGEVPAATGSSAPASPPVSPSPSSSMSPSASFSPSEQPPVTSTVRPHRPSATGGTAGTPAAPQWTPAAGYLSSAAVIDAHSNDNWAQGNLVLTTTETVTALDVVVSVARTDGVTSAGQWSSVPKEMLSMSVTEEKDALLYRFTLHEGATLAPGGYTFAAQYLHAAGRRDPGADIFGAIAAAGDRKVEINGAFATD
ncbi:hypothetical protein AMIS_9740 [Actinoplanes missouriensis 431]|uniref:Uncharacterized protein n=1 Tax=Actinoplanes missouriensis (strain ATCC 14538 / DSM 43046 / CBS 188.64 / JCM 3121 / NBRC 102363 / NCIMB 12654 / NRRL B-3342 / UNCC 431) TaxID=512565 RepID=I0GZK7_ACTM4|nr:hypothetical protein [Actinoplanes missouriensis]BAL86194.1 hypothetical protein AMIS_9740 [Actinoplanes missouriensis 431]